MSDTRKRYGLTKQCIVCSKWIFWNSKSDLCFICKRKICLKYGIDMNKSINKHLYNQLVIE